MVQKEEFSSESEIRQPLRTSTASDAHKELDFCISGHCKVFIT